MTYVVPPSDLGDLSSLSPPDLQERQAQVASCFDPCETLRLAKPQEVFPEPSQLEFSGEAALPTPTAVDRVEVVEPSSSPGATPETEGVDARPLSAGEPQPVAGIAPPEAFPPEDTTAIPQTQTPEPSLESTPESVSQVSPPETPAGFTVFPVGISIGQRTVEPGVLVKGLEDGSQAVEFADWLVPYDAVIRTLRLSVTPLPDGQLEMRSPGLVIRLDPDTIHTDPDLGLVFSIREIESLFGVPASFDINEYAIRFEPPWLTLRGTVVSGPELPVQLEGLPVISPPEVTVTQVEQRLNLADRGDAAATYQGDFSAVGALPGASWFVRMDQPELGNVDSWRLAEAQILRQRDYRDVTLGSQAAFWQEGGEADLWGLTVVGRNGFTPVDLQLGGTAPRQRLQSAQLGRTITGEAAPGTLVRLTEGFGDRILAEVSVDSSGVYRFDDVPFRNDLTGNNYLLLLYPNGRLTELPEIRTVSFSTVGGQIPDGTSAWAIAAGWDRDRSDDTGFLGEFDDFRGGATYRIGVSESTTLGAGVIYDNGLRALGEVFLQSGDVPLQLAASVLTPDDDDEWDWDASLRFDPSPTLRTSLTSDPIDTRLNLGWRVIPELELLALGRIENPSEFGFQLNLTGQNAFTYARVTLDTEGDLRWNGIQRLGRAELTTRGDNVSTFSEFTYNFSGDRLFDAGHAALISYETRDLDRTSGDLATVGWRYRSPKRAADGNYEWEARLGLGVGSEGSGLLASLQTTMLPGVLLRARYDGISATEDEDSFRLEVVSSLRLQDGIRPGDRRANYLRTQGGMLIQPFLDANHNGQYDPGELRYTDDANLLLILNNQPIRVLRPEVTEESIAMRIFPGTYRLDLDPAGFPLDWQPDTRAYAVVVNAGSYTVVPVPFVPAYTISGIATDAAGNPISGARIEAIAPTGERLFSVTNDAGVYYLEGLRQQTYSLQINGTPAQPGTIELDDTSEPFQDINLLSPQTQ